LEERSFALKDPKENSNAFRLDGKAAIITGAGSGIGLAIARKFASNGAFVHLLDINLEAAESAAQQILNESGKARAYGSDVTRQEEVKTILDEIFGQGRIHILINNAGIAHVGNLEKTTEEEFDRIFQVNVKGFYNCMFAVIEHMKGNGGGVILNMASIAAWSGLADRFAYSMSKGAVVAMTYSVARDYVQHGIRCNSISPARVHTPFVDRYLQQNYPGREKEMFEKLSQTQPIGRMAQPDEVASLALFLCSDDAAFITGSDYAIDGGFLNLHG
jgi:NAD(P)-dependent dehydrogenase (short-subunit alcohol dehydrogenase family)